MARTPLHKKPKLASYVAVLAPVLILVGYFQYRYNQSRVQQYQHLMPIRTIPCWRCDGKGQIPNTDKAQHSQRCRVCYGVGQRAIHLDPATQGVCTGCQGMGFTRDEELDLVTECLICEGFGSMNKPPPGQIKETIFDRAAETNAPPSPRFELLREPLPEKLE